MGLVSLGGSPLAPLRILCLGAHSDDIEIGCGGTLLRMLSERAGCTVYWVVFSAPGPREQEARSSAAEFLAEARESVVRVEHFRESFFPAVWSEIKECFESIKGEIEPDLILSHQRHELHQDHRVVAELTWNTFRRHLVLEYEIPKYEGDLGQPNFFVPLPLAIAGRKVDLIQRHFGSQASRAWFRGDTFHGLMSIRGVECQAPEGRAEAFYARKLAV